RLDQLGPAVKRQEVLERLFRLFANGDEVDELPVVLRREADSLLVRDAPHRRRIDRTTEMYVQFGELIAERVRHLARRLTEVKHRRRHEEAERVARGSGLRASR